MSVASDSLVATVRRPVASPTTAARATAVIPAEGLQPSAQAVVASAQNQTVSLLHSTAAPTYNSLGQALPPGKGSGLAITTTRAPFHTSTGEAFDPFKSYQGEAKSPAKTLSQLRASRRMAMRADPTYDLDGDGTVSQKDYFFASESRGRTGQKGLGARL